MNYNVFMLVKIVCVQKRIEQECFENPFVDFIDFKSDWRLSPRGPWHRPQIHSDTGTHRTRTLRVGLGKSGW